MNNNMDMYYERCFTAHDVNQIADMREALKNGAQLETLIDGRLSAAGLDLSAAELMEQVRECDAALAASEAGLYARDREEIAGIVRRWVEELPEGRRVPSLRGILGGLGAAGEAAVIRENGGMDYALKNADRYFAPFEGRDEQELMDELTNRLAAANLSVRQCRKLCFTPAGEEECFVSAADFEDRNLSLKCLAAAQLLCSRSGLSAADAAAEACCNLDFQSVSAALRAGEIGAAAANIIAAALGVAFIGFSIAFLSAAAATGSFGVVVISYLSVIGFGAAVSGGFEGFDGLGRSAGVAISRALSARGGDGEPGDEDDRTIKDPFVDIIY